MEEQKELTTEEQGVEEQPLEEDPTEDADRVELDPQEKLALLEALLFSCGDPLEPAKMKQIAELSDEQFEENIAALRRRYENPESGFELCQVGGKFQLRTKALYASYIRELKAGRPRKLSQAALETLAIVAYRQPIVKSDIEKIRGVDATPTLKTLLDRRIIKIAGHQASVGQPALYGTTDEFLKLFGLASLRELPTLRDIREMDNDPGEAEEQEENEEIPNASAA